MYQLNKLRTAIRNLRITEPEYLTYEQSANFIGKSYDAVRKMVALGKLPAHQAVDGRVYLRVADLNSYMAGKVKSVNQNDVLSQTEN